MRHGIAGNKLGRNQTLRKATIRDLAKATLKHQRICTTKAKAKEARKMVDKLITLGKKGELAHKRRAFAILCDHKLVSELFNTIAPRFKERAGGYTRIIPYTFRKGDNAEQAFLELTEKPEVIVSEPKTKEKSKKAPTAAKTTEPKDSATTETKPKDTKKKFKDESKKESIKSEDKKAATQKEKGLVGGIRKMFKRKTGGGN